MHRAMRRFTLSIGVMAAFAILISAGDFSARSAAETSRYLLVTDVDDTIKVSHINDFKSKVIRYLKSPVPFAGMPRLYGHMLNEATSNQLNPTFMVLSGTPTLFESSIYEFLEVFNFPEPFRVQTRSLLVDTKGYKTEAVVDLIGERTGDSGTIILIGDDTEHDFAAYRDSVKVLGRNTPFQTQIYIRRVNKSATGQTSWTTFQGAVAFDSAADIAAYELSENRLSRAAVEEVFSDIEKEKEFQRLFVPGEYCPDEHSPRLSALLKSKNFPADLQTRLIKIEDLLRRRCRSFNAWISSLLG